MTRKESLEKIAQTFWGKPKRKERSKKIFFLISTIFIFLVILVIMSAYLFSHGITKLKPETKILTFDLDREIIRLNYNFKDADLKTEKYTINLGNLNLVGFKRLEISCRKAKPKGEISLKVEIENSLKEKASCYISGIKNQWQIFGVNLEEFKEINDWSSVKNLSFVIEEWNTQEKFDTVYIDQIMFKKGGKF